MAALPPQHEEPAPSCKQQVYMVTIPRALPHVTHEMMSASVRDAFQNPVYGGPGPQVALPIGRGLVVDKAVTFREAHADGQPHFHVAIRLKSPQRWLGAKRALLERYGIQCHFSDSHSQFWSAVRYGTTPSEHKAEVDKVWRSVVPGRGTTLYLCYERGNLGMTARGLQMIY